MFPPQSNIDMLENVQCSGGIASPMKALLHYFLEGHHPFPADPVHKTIPLFPYLLYLIIIVALNACIHVTTTNKHTHTPRNLKFVESAG